MIAPRHLLTALSALGVTEVVLRLGIRFHRQALPDGRLCFVEYRPGDEEEAVSGEALGILRPGEVEHPISLHAPYTPGVAEIALQSWFRRFAPGHPPLIAVEPHRSLAAVARLLRACAGRPGAPPPPRPGEPLRLVR